MKRTRLRRRTSLRPRHRASIGDVLTLMHHFGTVPRCVRCGEPAEDFHHVLPKGRGGSDELSNIAPLDRRCHIWVHSNPEAANQAGLLRHSWEGEA